MGKTLPKGMGPQAVGRRVGTIEAPSPGLFPRLILMFFLITLAQNVSMR